MAISKKVKVQIIKALRKDTQATMLDVANQVGVTAPTVRRVAESRLGPRVLKRIQERCLSLRGKRSGLARRGNRIKGVVGTTARGKGVRIPGSTIQAITNVLKSKDFDSCTAIAKKFDVSLPTVTRLAANLGIKLKAGYRKRAQENKAHKLEQLDLFSTPAPQGTRATKCPQVTITLKNDGALDSYESTGEVNVVVFRRK